MAHEDGRPPSLGTLGDPSTRGSFLAPTHASAVSPLYRGGSFDDERFEGGDAYFDSDARGHFSFPSTPAQRPPSVGATGSDTESFRSRLRRYSEPTTDDARSLNRTPVRGPGGAAIGGTTGGGGFRTPASESGPIRGTVDFTDPSSAFKHHPRTMPSHYYGDDDGGNGGDGGDEHRAVGRISSHVTGHTSPSKADAARVRQLREMWLHETATSHSLRNLVDDAAVTSQRHVAVLQIALELCRARTLDGLVTLVQSSSALHTLLSASSVNVFLRYGLSTAASAGSSLWTVTPGSASSMAAVAHTAATPLVPGAPSHLSFGFQYNVGLVGRLMASGDILCTSAPEELGHYTSETRRMAPDGLRSLLCVPLRGEDGAVLGFLEATNCLRAASDGMPPGTSGFVPEDEESATVVAHFVSRAVGVCTDMAAAGSTASSSAQSQLMLETCQRLVMEKLSQACAAVEAATVLAPTMPPDTFAAGGGVGGGGGNRGLDSSDALFPGANGGLDDPGLRSRCGRALLALFEVIETSARVLGEGGPDGSLGIGGASGVSGSHHPSLGATARLFLTTSKTWPWQPAQPSDVPRGSSSSFAGFPAPGDPHVPKSSALAGFPLWSLAASHEGSEHPARILRTPPSSSGLICYAVTEGRPQASFPATQHPFYRSTADEALGIPSAAAVFCVPLLETPEGRGAVAGVAEGDDLLSARSAAAAAAGSLAESKEKEWTDRSNRPAEPGSVPIGVLVFSCPSAFTLEEERFVVALSRQVAGVLVRLRVASRAAVAAAKASVFRSRLVLALARGNPGRGIGGLDASNAGTFPEFQPLEERDYALARAQSVTFAAPPVTPSRSGDGSGRRRSRRSSLSGVGAIGGGGRGGGGGGSSSDALVSSPRGRRSSLSGSARASRRRSQSPSVRRSSMSSVGGGVPDSGEVDALHPPILPSSVTDLPSCLAWAESRARALLGAARVHASLSSSRTLPMHDSDLSSDDDDEDEGHPASSHRSRRHGRGSRARARARVWNNPAVRFLAEDALRDLGRPVVASASSQDSRSVTTFRNVRAWLRRGSKFDSSSASASASASGSSSSTASAAYSLAVELSVPACSDLFRSCLPPSSSRGGEADLDSPTSDAEDAPDSREGGGLSLPSRAFLVLQVAMPDSSVLTPQEQSSLIRPVLNSVVDGIYSLAASFSARASFGRLRARVQAQAAFERIARGQRLLISADSRTSLTQAVSSVVSDALECDFAALYLHDPAQSVLWTVADGASSSSGRDQPRSRAGSVSSSRASSPVSPARASAGPDGRSPRSPHGSRPGSPRRAPDSETPGVQKVVPGLGAAGSCFTSGSSLRLDSRTLSDPKFASLPSAPLASAKKHRNVLCVPVASAGRVVGVIMAADKDRGEFSEADEHALTVLASSAIAVLERCAASDAAEARVRTLRNELSKTKAAASAAASEITQLRAHADDIEAELRSVRQRFRRKSTVAALDEWIRSVPPPPPRASAVPSAPASPSAPLPPPPDSPPPLPPPPSPRPRSLSPRSNRSPRLADAPLRPSDDALAPARSPHPVRAGAEIAIQTGGVDMGTDPRTPSPRKQFMTAATNPRTPSPRHTHTVGVDPKTPSIRSVRAAATDPKTPSAASVRHALAVAAYHRATVGTDAGSGSGVGHGRPHVDIPQTRLPGYSVHYVGPAAGGQRSPGGGMAVQTSPVPSLGGATFSSKLASPPRVQSLRRGYSPSGRPHSRAGFRSSGVHSDSAESFAEEADDTDGEDDEYFASGGVSRLSPAGGRRSRSRTRPHRRHSTGASSRSAPSSPLTRRRGSRQSAGAGTLSFVSRGAGASATGSPPSGTPRRSRPRRASAEDIFALSSAMHIPLRAGVGDGSTTPSSRNNIDALFTETMWQVRDLLGADRATLYLVDHDTNEIWSKIADGSSAIRLPIGKGIAGHVAASGQVLNIPDAYEDPRFDQTVDMQSGYHTRSLLCVPVLSGGEVLGVIQLINKTGGVFAEEDESLAQLAAVQVANTLRNLKEFEVATNQHRRTSQELLRLRRQLQEESSTNADVMEQHYQMKLLLHLAALAGSAQDVESLTHMVEEDLGALLEARTAVLYFVDEEANDLWSASPGDAGGRSEVRLAFGQGLAGFVAESGEALNLAEAGEDPRLDLLEEQRLRTRVTSLLVVPVFDGQHRTVGVLQVANKVAGTPFAASDETVAETAATHIGVAISRCRQILQHHDEMRLAMERIGEIQAILQDVEHGAVANARGHKGVLKTCRDLLASISDSGFDLASMFRHVSVACCEAVGADYAQLFVPETIVSSTTTEAGGEEASATVQLKVFSEQDGHFLYLPTSASPAGQAVMSACAVRTEAYADELWSQDVLVAEQPVRERLVVLCVPLHDSESRVVAVLQVCRILRDESSMFSSQEELLLTILGGHIRMLVEGSRTIDSLAAEKTAVESNVDACREEIAKQQQYSQQLDAMCLVNEAFGHADSLLQLCEAVRDRVPALVGAEGVTLFLVDRSAQDVWTPVKPHVTPVDPPSASGSSGSPRSPRSPRSPMHSPVRRGGELEVRVPLGVGIVGFVADHGEVINCQEAYDDPRFDPQERTVARTRSLICVPVRNEDGVVVAVLQSCNKQEGAFSSEDQELLETVSHHISVAFKRCEGSSATRRRVRHAASALKELQSRVDAADEEARSARRAYSVALSTCRSSLEAFDFGFTPAPVFAMASEGAKSVTGADIASLVLADDASQELVVYGDDGQLSHRHPMENSVVGSAVMSGSVVRGTYSAQQLCLSTGDLVRVGENLQALVVPIPGFGPRPVGALQLAKRAGSPPFTTEEEDLLQILALQVRLVIEASQLVRTLREEKAALADEVDAKQRVLQQTDGRIDYLRTSEQRLNGVCAVGMKLSALVSPIPLFDVVWENVAVLLDCDASCLFLVDKESGEVHSRVPVHAETGQLTASADGEVRLVGGVGLVGHVAETGETLSITNPFDNPRFHPSERVVPRLRSSLYVPIKDSTSGRVLGVLMCCNKKGADSFTSEDENAARAIAGFISTVLVRHARRLADPTDDAVIRIRDLESQLHEHRRQYEEVQAGFKQAIGANESAAEQERRLKHKAVRLLTVCRKQEKTLAGLMLLYHHCFSEKVFEISCIHARDVLSAMDVVFYAVREDEGGLVATAHSDSGPLSDAIVPLTSDAPASRAAATGLPVNRPAVAGLSTSSRARSPSPVRSVRSRSRSRSRLASPSRYGRDLEASFEATLSSTLPEGTLSRSGRIAVPVCTREGKEYVVGVFEAVARGGKSFTPDDERLLGCFATQVAFVMERRKTARALQDLVGESSRSVKDWRALVAEKESKIMELMKSQTDNSRTSAELQAREEALRHMQEERDQLLKQVSKLERRSRRSADAIEQLTQQLREAEDSHRFLRSSKSQAETAEVAAMQAKLAVSEEKLRVVQANMEAVRSERDAADSALQQARSQLVLTSQSLDQLRGEYEALLARHQLLQKRMDQLVALSSAEEASMQQFR